MLIRLFRGVIREGAHDRLLRALHDQVLPRLEAHPAVSSTTLAVALEGSADEYLEEWNGSTVHLPPREMAAMLALARAVVPPVTSSDLARWIWPGSAMVTPYDVRRVVHQLRVLLRSSDTPLRIHNVHGVGYGLELEERS